jgi:hypothetical protein
MGGSSSTQTSTKVDPALMALYNQNYANASASADKYAYTPYTGEQVAGFTPAQQQSFGILTNAATDPTSTNALKQSMGVFSDLSNYQPTQVQAKTVANTDLSPYLNPYTQDVINSSLATLNQQRGQQQVADNASATAANAFGGTRQAVQRALTSGQYDLNSANLIANLNSQNFNQAQQAALNDITQGNQVGEFNATNANTAAQLRGNAALGGAQLGQDYLNQLIQQGGILNNVGAQQQSLQQAQDEAAYQEFLRQTQAPIVAQQLRNQALGMIPQQATTTSNTQSSPGIGGILGGIGSLALGLGTMGVGSGLGSTLFGGTVAPGIGSSFDLGGGLGSISSATPGFSYGGLFG